LPRLFPSSSHAHTTAAPLSLWSWSHPFSSRIDWGVDVPVAPSLLYATRYVRPCRYAYVPLMCSRC
jgi:hypothetical protein